MGWGQSCRCALDLGLALGPMVAAALGLMVAAALRLMVAAALGLMLEVLLPRAQHFGSQQQGQVLLI